MWREAKDAKAIADGFALLKVSNRYLPCKVWKLAHNSPIITGLSLTSGVRSGHCLIHHAVWRLRKPVSRRDSLTGVQPRASIRCHNASNGVSLPSLLLQRHPVLAQRMPS
ncbi:Uncharacterised protein [Escherichia coli]|uniref:Uncharacterized protein n=1 Tax=Escherichia coli TaxID=562 RepID=A0A376MUV3_ECOLX|nr:Uncharacterised protein [Escherichia coli]